MTNKGIVLRIYLPPFFSITALVFSYIGYSVLNLTVTLKCRGLKHQRRRRQRKWNRDFSNYVTIIATRLKCQMLVNFPEIDFWRTIFKREKIIICHRLFTSSKNVLSYKDGNEEMYKNAWYTSAECLLVFHCGRRQVTKLLYVTVRATATDNWYWGNVTS